MQEALTSQKIRQLAQESKSNWWGDICGMLFLILIWGWGQPKPPNHALEKAKWLVNEIESD